jgi:hypothetical protein
VAFQDSWDQILAELGSVSRMRGCNPKYTSSSLSVPAKRVAASPSSNPRYFDAESTTEVDSGVVE